MVPDLPQQVGELRELAGAECGCEQLFEVGDVAWRRGLHDATTLVGEDGQQCRADRWGRPPGAT